MRQVNTILAILSSGLLLISAGIVKADPIIVEGDAADYGIRFNTVTEAVTADRETNASLFVGRQLDTLLHNAVYVFELPQLPANHLVDTASLRFQLNTSFADLGFNVDLWGIGFQENTDPILKYLASDTSTDPETVKLVAGVISQGSSSTASNQLFTTSSPDFADYLNTFYIDNPGYVDGTYVFLRLNPDADPLAVTGGNSVAIRTAEATQANSEPLLTLTTFLIPEPASLFVLGMGVLLISQRKNRLR